MTRAEQDFAAWQRWKHDPTPTNMGLLLKQVENLIEDKVREYRGVNVPPQSIRLVATGLAAKALAEYDPDRTGFGGRRAELATYLHNPLKKVGVFVMKHQNVAKIPVHRKKEIRVFKMAKEEMTERLGRPPDTIQLADHLGWSVKQVMRTETELRQDRIASWEEPAGLDTADEERDEEILTYIAQELTSDERLVFEYSTGRGGRPKLQAQEIARIMGKSKPWVSGIRRRIDVKLSHRGL